MIRTIHIKNFRGFRDFRLQGLNELTILTGPNGCGKSTILDALLLGASSSCPHAVGFTAQRRQSSWDGARWLFNETKRSVEIRLESESSSVYRKLTFQENANSHTPTATEALTARGQTGPFRLITCSDQTDPEPVFLGYCTLALSNEYELTERLTGPIIAPYTRLIDTAIPKYLDTAFSKVVQSGLRSRILNWIRPLIPGIESIDILKEDNRESSIYITWPDHAVPLSFVGDGIAAALRIAIEASNVEPGGLVLIEEPEVFLHPKAISVIAGLLLELMRESRQVVLTTHSLELIDSLLGRSEAADLDKISLFNLRPTKGEPTIIAWPGRELEFVREKIGDDLR